MRWDAGVLVHGTESWARRVPQPRARLSGTIARMKALWAVLACALVAAGACGDDDDTASTSTGDPSGPGASVSVSASVGASSSGSGGDGGSAEGGGGASAFMLTSPAFTEGGAIPDPHVCQADDMVGDGIDQSPELNWTGAPATALSFAVVFRDRSNGDLVHWVIWDIPASETGLPEAVEDGFEPSDPAGAKQANDGYFGPCSPASDNTYEFTVYAIDVAELPGLDEDSTRDEAVQVVEEHDLASATLSGEA
jgi:Raf kinase inhibitor-like YbhB/YbcL family protein